MASPSWHLPALRVAGWDAIPNLVHGFLGRRGGVSRGAFAELNLSDRMGDAPEAVRENWRRVREQLDGLECVRLQQVHGARVVNVEHGGGDAGAADALVTQRPAIALGVLTADCVPVLMVAPNHHAVAAVHAGWRGTLSGVVQQAVVHLTRTSGAPASGLRVALGPAIGGCCYEVDRGIADALERRWGSLSEAVLRVSSEKAMVDLRAVNEMILVRTGVRRAQIVRAGPCTRCAATEYFSHRATIGPTGRQWSVIGWRA